MQYASDRVPQQRQSPRRICTQRKQTTPWVVQHDDSPQSLHVKWRTKPDAQNERAHGYPQQRSLQLGWELHIPTEYAGHVYDTLWSAGQVHGVADVGYRAIESLRLEKGYLYWSSDITPDHTPLEAGLRSRVHFRAKGDFVGRQSLLAEAAGTPARRLCTFVSERRFPARGGESVLFAGRVVGIVSSAAYGYTVGRMILLAYLPVELVSEESFEVEAYCERYQMNRVQGPVYDPLNHRLKA